MKEQELILAGVDVKELLARTMQNEKLTRMIVEKFLQDKTYDQLCQAAAQGDRKAAEFACHSLKGVCGNLSLKNLYALTQEQLRLFRTGEPEQAVAMMTDICADFENAVVHLRRWLEEN